MSGVVHVMCESGCDGEEQECREDEDARRGEDGSQAEGTMSLPLLSNSHWRTHVRLWPLHPTGSAFPASGWSLLLGAHHLWWYLTVLPSQGFSEVQKVQ